MNIMSLRRRTCRETARGFTIIELVLVIAVIGILAAIAIPGYFWVQSWAKTRAARSTMDSIKTAISSYKLTVGTFPKNLEDLVKKPAGEAARNWAGPYLEKEDIPLDPWYQPYHYQYTPGQGKHHYELYSDGDPDKPIKIDVWE